MQVLAGDIGGTKTLVAICEVSPPDGRTGAVSVEILVSKRYDSRKFPGIAALCRAFAAEVARPIRPSASFAPRTELEIGVLRFLMQRYDHVSWERVLSGEGLVNLAEALSHLTGVKPTEALGEKIAHDRGNAPAAITAAAAAGDPLCRQVVELFCKLYGAEAGNLALKTLATGGVYVAGGIAPKILDFMTDGRFRAAFVDKGRMRPMLERMPVQIVLDTRAGLLGAATLAAREAQLAPQTRSSPST